MKLFGIGLNKTGTKTLANYLRQLGFRHRSYDSSNTYESPSFRLYRAGKIDELVDLMEEYDSCEDWPWPLLYRELDERYPDARFVLTVRESPEAWYRSLCNMAVRIGPLPLYERLVYGHDMPQGHRDEHIGYYLRHNDEVTRHFADRPDKLLEICWDRGDDPRSLTRFLGIDADLEPIHVNRSPRRGVYSGENLLLARASRFFYQKVAGPRAVLRRRLTRRRSVRS